MEYDLVNECLGKARDCAFVEQASQADWTRVERDLLVEFPEEYKRFVSAFGSGRFGSDLYVVNPAACGGLVLNQQELLRYRESRALRLDRIGREVYPARGGLIRIAGTTSLFDLFFDPKKLERRVQHVVLADLDMGECTEIPLCLAGVVFTAFAQTSRERWASLLRKVVWGDSQVPFFTPSRTCS